MCRNFARNGFVLECFNPLQASALQPSDSDDIPGSGALTSSLGDVNRCTVACSISSASFHDEMSWPSKTCGCPSVQPSTPRLGVHRGAALLPVFVTAKAELQAPTNSAFCQSFATFSACFFILWILSYPYAMLRSCKEPFHTQCLAEVHNK